MMAAIALSLVASASLARAQDSDPPPGTKDGVTAAAYSLLGTSLPCVASAIIISGKGKASAAAAGFPILAGYLVGPSLGHFYAERPKRAWIGIGIRAAAAVVFAVGLGMEEEKRYDVPSANGWMLVSVLAGVSSTLVDIGDAPRSVRLHNRGLEHSGINLTPAAIGLARAPGLRADLTF